MKEGWIDSHAHLFSEEFQGETDSVVQRAKEAGFCRIMTVCGTIAEAVAALEYQKKEPMLDIAVGFHPQDIPGLRPQDWQELEALAQKPEIRAIGEIGLDLHYGRQTLSLQKEALVRQIALANRVHKPVLIHSRDAAQLTLECLQKNPVQRRGVIHCFSYSPEMAVEFGKRGYKVGLGGVVTFSKAKTAKEVAVHIPLTWLLVETDCPYMAPVPFRGRRNEPAYAVNTYQALAVLRGIPVTTLRQAVYENYQAFLNGPVSETGV